MSDGGEALCGVKSVLSGTGAPVCGRKDRSKKRFLLFLRRVVARKMRVRYILVCFLLWVFRFNADVTILCSVYPIC